MDPNTRALIMGAAGSGGAQVLATDVFSPDIYTGTGSSKTITNGIDLSGKGGVVWFKDRTSGSYNNWAIYDTARGVTKQLATSNTESERTINGYDLTAFNSNGFTVGANWDNRVNTSLQTYASWTFRKAAGFFDVVAYTGTGGTLNVTHNLGVTPELMIIKQRSAIRNWIVYSAGVSAPTTSFLRLNTTDAVITGVTTHWNSTAPTSTVFTVGNDTDVNASAGTYIAYLFATCPGVSKVGSYTGSGTTKDIDCGFANGARFVLIKRTDSTGDWYVWDTARGIVSGNDSYLLLNSTAAEVTTTDYIDPLSSGFQISSTAPAAINASGGSFIYLAVA